MEAQLLTDASIKISSTNLCSVPPAENNYFVDIGLVQELHYNGSSIYARHQINGKLANCVDHNEVTKNVAPHPGLHCSS